jgi:hypothetical protein
MFEPKEHKYSIPFTGNAEAAIRIARTSLLSLGFEISAISENELHATGPGMHSTQQPDLLGVSKLKLRVDVTSITAVAKLGSAAKMKAFVYIFPPALVLLLLIIFTLTGMDVSWHYVLWVLPWIFIAPWMGNRIERRTIRAVDRLVRGMAQSR